MPVWKYNGKCYINMNDTQVTDYAVDKSKADGDIEVIIFTKYMPYILDLTSYKYESGRNKEPIKGYTISKINKMLLDNYIQNGIIRIQFNTNYKTIWLFKSL